MSEHSPDELDAWADTVRTALELPGDAIDVAEVLRLAGDAAHRVVRPAAPVTTYLVGLAVGRALAAGDDAAAARAAALETVHALLPADE